MLLSFKAVQLELIPGTPGSYTDYRLQRLPKYTPPRCDHLIRVRCQVFYSFSIAPLSICEGHVLCS